MTDFIYLASQSPRRRQLLDQLGVRHELLLPHAAGEEAEDAEGLEAALPGEWPDAYVQRVTALKLDAAVARHARRGLPAAPILCAPELSQAARLLAVNASAAGRYTIRKQHER